MASSYNVVYLDGMNTMEIKFPNQDVAASWMNLQSHIKNNADVLFPFVEVAGGRYDCMRTDQKKFGEHWLKLVGQLREMSPVIPPSIEKAERAYIAVKQGDYE